MDRTHPRVSPLCNSLLVGASRGTSHARSGDCRGLQPLISETNGCDPSEPIFPCRRLVVTEVVIHFMNCSPWVLLGDQPLLPCQPWFNTACKGEARSRAAGNCYTWCVCSTEVARFVHATQARAGDGSAGQGHPGLFDDVTYGEGDKVAYPASRPIRQAPTPMGDLKLTEAAARRD